MKFPLFILLLISSTSLFSQIEVSEPREVQAMIETWERQNFQNPYVAGWRVQIGASNDLNHADELKAAFVEQFPGVPVDWVQEYPYYKVRAGAFLTKKEANALIAKVSAKYPGAYAAKVERIPVSEF